MQARLLPGLALVAALSLTGCMADDYQANSGTGRVSLDVSVNPDVQDAAISRATASTINAEDLTIRLSAEDGSYSKQWNYSDFPADGQYVIGSYLMEAFYGSESDEGFDSPYYYGSSSFQIKHNQTSSVAFEVTLANSMVTLQFEESFKNYLQEYSAVLTSSTGKSYDYTAADEGNAIYLKPGKVSLAINCTLPTGTSGSFKVADFNVAAKNHYRMTLGINSNDPSNPGAGASSLTISFDEALQKEPITIELSEEIFNAPAPTITTSFDATQTLTLTEGEAPTEPLGMTLLAQGEFASVLMTTQSQGLISQGWPAEIELMSATTEQRDKLKNLGLMVLGLYQNPEQMAQLDFTNVISHLNYVEGQSNQNTFTVKVTDLNGKESEAVSFTVAISEIKCQIIDHMMTIGSDNLQLMIAYNGKNAKDNVKISYRSELGSYTQFTQNSFTDNGDGTFSYDLTTTAKPKVATSIDVKIEYMGKVLEQTLDCGAPNFGIKAYNIFATYAIVEFDYKFAFEALMNDLSLFISKNGGDFSALTYERIAGTYRMKISGLTPNTSYTVKGSLLGKDSVSHATFTTEAATQLPNSGMEEWFRVDGATQYWWVEYPGADTNAAWGTMNLLTTSIGGSDTGVFSTNRNGTSYCAFSGTRATTDSYSGEKAAIIETVGWGKGNTGASTAANIIRYITAGELYLGSYNSSTSSPDYGYPFSSRPSSLSFWYKYSPKNSADYGTALIQVFDSAGQVISENNINLTSQGSYTQITLPLSYTTTSKAAKISVAFKSCGDSKYLEKNANNLSFAGSSNSARNTGSSLYIDEIILNY